MDKKRLSDLVSHQLNSFFGEKVNISEYQDAALKRVQNCFKHCANKYYVAEQENILNPFHSVQYSIYLYYLANSIYRLTRRNQTSEQLYYLNKVMNSVDWYYEIDLPDVFCAEHPLSSVMGRASYSNKFFFYQGCTVGGNKGKYPKLGENVVMYANSTIIGDSHIGNNVIVSIGTIIKDEVIPDNSLVFGQSPNLIIKSKAEEEILELTKQFWKIS